MDAERDDGGTELDESQANAPSPVTRVDRAEGASAARGRPAWGLFLALAALVVVADQLSKSWVIANIAPGSVVPILGDLVRLLDSRNSGGLFGVFASTAPIFAVVSLGVIALIVFWHARSGRNLLLSLALGLLLGGAIGNLVDRVRLGAVVDWVDVGLGDIRWWTFNVGDAAISVAILLLIALAVWPSLGASASDG